MVRFDTRHVCSKMGRCGQKLCMKTNYKWGVSGGGVIFVRWGRIGLSGFVSPFQVGFARGFGGGEGGERVRKWW